MNGEDLMHEFDVHKFEEINRLEFNLPCFQTPVHETAYQ